MTWRVARSLDVLLAELNAAAPNRSKLSDGSIGDAAHASRSSDHNPWVIDSDGIGVVRARDFTHDPADGLDCNQLAPFLAGLLGEHPALRSGAYVIWNRRIISRDRISEGWRPYTGSNPHDHHLHLSVALDEAGYDSTAPWGWDTEEDPMAGITLDEIREVVREEVATGTDEAVKRILKPLRQQVSSARARARQNGATLEQVREDLDAIAAAVGVDED